MKQGPHFQKRAKRELTKLTKPNEETTHQVQDDNAAAARSTAETEARSRHSAG
jgi:hypothetical protein